MVTRLTSFSRQSLRLFCIWLCTQAFALQAATTLTAQIDKNPVMVGEEVLLTVQVDEKLSSSAIDFSGIPTAFESSAPAISQSMQIINGQSSQSTRWQWRLLATTAGQFEIPAFQYQHLSSQPIQIEVLAAQQLQGAARDLFIESSLSATELYVQQMVYYEVKIFYSGDLQRGRLSQPELADTTIEQIGKDIESSEIIDGKRYQTITRRYSFIPQQSGTFKLKAPWFQGEMIDRSSSRYDYFAQTKAVSAQGQDLQVVVKAMPDGFPGQWLVSELVALSEEWSIAPEDWVQGEPVTRTVTLTALDVAEHQLPDVPLSQTSTIKSYAEQPQNKQAERNGRRVSQRVFSSALIATTPGEIRIPAIQLPWWNSKTNQMQYAELPEQVIQVRANPQQTNTAAITTIADADSPQALEAVAASNPWQWNNVSYLLTILWLTSLSVVFFYWSPKRQTANTFKPHPLASEVRFNAKKLKSACLANDVQQSKEQLLRWGSQTFDPSLRELPSLLRYLPTSELRREIEKLAYLDYQATSTAWQGQALFESWSKYKQMQEVQKASALKALYPNMPN